ncbi:MAG TPA: DnaB-like helicase C-terminal domain-containing protein, partial [Aggregatilineales bacterium]|nr:DnaB-like helicase C-terminal domain-containing protein [Aggregatilineales bacterium]
KGRKTSLMLNLMLNLAEDGASTAILMFESSQFFVKCQVLSMLAMRWLKEMGMYNKADNFNYPMYMGLSAKDIHDARNSYEAWHPTRKQALKEAFNRMRRLGDRLRIYSTGYKTGKLSDLQSCQRILMYDKRRYGTDIASIDHLQRIQEQGNIYERMSKVSNTLEGFARREEVALLLLSQMNEEGIKAESVGNSPNVKGGGDLSAAVDYMVSLAYSASEDSTSAYLTLNMRLSRYGAGGKEVKSTLEIEPVSGLLGKENVPVKLELPI